MLVLAEDAAEAVASVDVQVGESIRVSDRFGQSCERSGVRDSLMRPVMVKELFVLAQRVE